MFGIDLGNLIAHLNLDARQYNAALNDVERRMKMTADRLNHIGRTLSTRLTLPLAAIGASGVAALIKFDDAMTKSLAIFGDVNAEMRKEMEHTAAVLSKDSTQSSTDLAKAYFYLGSAGLNAEQAIKSLGAVERFATAGSFDLSAATEMAVGSQAALGLTSKNTAENLKNLTRVTDVLSTANELSQATISQFSEALTNEAAAAMKTWGIELEEGVSILAAYAKQNTKGAEAGSSFGRMLRFLMMGARENAAEWKRMNLELYDSYGNLRPLADVIEDMSKVLGDLSPEAKSAELSLLGFQARSQQVILPLLGMSDEIKTFNERLKEAGEHTAVLATKNMESFAAQLTVTWHHITGFAKEIGQRLIPYVMALGEQIKAVTTWFTNLSNAQKDTLVKWGLMIAAIGPLILLVGQLTTAFTLLVVALEAHPFLLAAVALTMLGTAIIDFGYNSDISADKAKRMKKVMADLTSIVKEAKNTQQEYNEAVKAGDRIAQEQTIREQINLLTAAVTEIEQTISRVGTNATVKRKMLESLIPGSVDIRKYWEEALKGLAPEEVEKYVGSFFRGGPYDKTFKAIQESMLFVPVTNIDKTLYDVTDKYGRLVVSTEEFSERMRNSFTKAFLLDAVPASDALEVINSEIEKLEESIHDVAVATSELGTTSSDTEKLLTSLITERQGLLQDVVDALKEEKEMQPFILQGYQDAASIVKYQKALQQEALILYQDTSDEVEKQAKIQAFVNDKMSEYLSLTKELESLRSSQQGVADDLSKKASDMVESLKAELEAIPYINQGFDRSSEIIEYKNILLKQAEGLYENITDEAEKQALVQAYVTDNMEEYLGLLKQLQMVQESGSFEQWIRDAKDLGKAFEEDVVRGLDALSDALTNMITGAEVDWKQFTASILRMFLRSLVEMEIAQAAFAARSFIKNLFTGAAIGAATGAGAYGDTGGGGPTGGGSRSMISGAKGLVFNAGDIIPMAMGGLLNSIVTQPTYVPMSSGKTALIGEGHDDEGVFPLTRNSNGQLGVRAEQPNVNVQNKLKIVNVMSQEEYLAAIQTDAGERVIMNMLRRNGVV